MGNMPAFASLLVLFSVNSLLAVPPPPENPCNFGYLNCVGCSNISRVNGSEYYGTFTCRQATLLTFADGIKEATVNREPRRFTCDAWDAKSSVFLKGRKLTRMECIPFATENHATHACFKSFASSHYKNPNSVIPIMDGVAEFVCRDIIFVTYTNNTSVPVQEQCIRISCDQYGNIFYKNNKVKFLECRYFV